MPDEQPVELISSEEADSNAPPAQSPPIGPQIASRLGILVLAYVFARVLLRATRSLALNRRIEAGGLPANLLWDTSWIVARDNPVSAVVNARLGNTLILLVVAMIIAGLVAALAVLVFQSARRMQHGHTGVLGLGLELLGRIWAFHRASAPVFWFGLMMIIVFSLKFKEWGLPALPSGGVLSLRGVMAGTLPDRILHLVMPVAVLVPFPAYLTAQAIARTLTYETSDLSQSRRRSLAFMTGLSTLTSQGGGLLSAVVIVEIIFAYNGLGRLFFESIFRLDLPLVYGCLVAFATIVLLFRFIADPLTVLAARWATNLPTQESEWLGRTRHMSRSLTLALVALPLLIALLSIIAPLLAPSVPVASFETTAPGGLLPDPNASNPPLQHRPFGTPGHLLGTDEIGRDIGSRLLFGTRNSLFTALFAALLAAALGTLGGLFSAILYSRRSPLSSILADLVLLPADTLMMLPIIPAFFFYDALFHSGGRTLIIGIGLLLSARATRAVRHAWLSTPELGFSRARLLSFSPTFLGIWLVALLTLAPLSFLGLGIQQPTASLGNMLTRVQDYMFLNPTLAIWPGLLLWGLTFSLYSLAGLVGKLIGKSPELHWLNQ